MGGKQVNWDGSSRFGVDYNKHVSLKGYVLRILSLCVSLSLKVDF